MLLTEIISKLPDNKYKECIINATKIVLPFNIEINKFKIDAYTNIVLSQLTDEKAVYAALETINSRDKIPSYINKLKEYYVVKK